MKRIIYDEIHVTVAAPRELPPSIRTELLHVLRKLPQRIEAAVQNELLPEDLRTTVQITVKP